jgi:flagellar motor switch protein FliN/FliY
MTDGSKLIGHVISSLSQSTASMTGQTFNVALDSSAENPLLEGVITWQQVFSLTGGPSFWITAGKDLWEALGRVTLEAAGIEEVAEEDCRSTWQEILNQTAAGMASALTADLGREVTVADGAEIATEPTGVTWRVFTVTGDKGQRWLFRAAWTKELEGSGEVKPEEVKTPAAKDNSVSKTFDLLLEVALPIAVSFGRTSLQIREVLKLNTGSIVELDRFVTDPVEVIVNNCVIARGEVVVVDGNYGVRINQLASKEERLRTGMSDKVHRGVRI